MEGLFPITTPKMELEPDKIWIRENTTKEAVALQRQMSRAIWRPAPGRRVATTLWYEQELLGLLYISSPVYILGARDTHLGIPKDSAARGEALKSYLDVSVCVAAQPIGWYWNIGKLMAMVATSTTMKALIESKYPDASIIGLTTTSMWGRSSQYNRVFKFLGYTKGYGHGHITEEKYAEIVQYLKAHGLYEKQKASSLAGRMSRIETYRKHSGDQTVSIKHGQKRGVYYAPMTSATAQERTYEWYNRWGLPRWRRTRDQEPPYRSGISADGEQSFR